MEEKEARRLVESYGDLIYRIGVNYLKNASDAEDICQTVFLKYIVSDFHFENQQHEKAWIIRTTINACKDVLKSSAFKNTTTLEELGDIKATESHETGITEEVMKLPHNYRICIFFYYYEGYSIKEIASILQKTELSVRTLLSRARKKLQLTLREDMQ